MIRLLDYSLGGNQGVTNDKIRQVCVAQLHRTQEQRFFLGPNAQGHPAVVFHRPPPEAFSGEQQHSVVVDEEQRASLWFGFSAE